jgi:endonuclease III
MHKRKPAGKSRSRPFSPTLAHSRLLFARLNAAYPDAKCALDHRNAFQLIVATILSAQCTDARVNLVTPVLFARYPDAFALARATQSDVEEIIRSTGFFRNKAKSLIAMAQALVAGHHGYCRALGGRLRTSCWATRSASTRESRWTPT